MKRVIKRGLLGLGLGLLWNLGAQALPTVQTWQTAEGMRVYFMPAPELPILDLRLAFDAASARDEKTPGLASLTSNLLAEGAGGLSAEQLAERFDEVGAQFSTGAQRDMAWINLRTVSDPTLCDPVLETLALVLGKPDFPEKALERTRKQMLQNLEYQKQSPAELASNAFYAALYQGHPYASPPDGTEASLKALDRAQVLAFYQRYYVANNSVLAIIGALDQTSAQEIAATLSAVLKPGTAAPALPPVPTASQPITQHLAYPSTQTHVQFGQLGYHYQNPERFALYVGNHVLGGGGLVSRLSEEVREKRGLSYSVYSHFTPMQQPGPFIASLQTRNDQRTTAVTVLQETIRRFVTEGPTEAELTAAKQNLTGSFALQIDSNAKLVGYLATIGFYHLPLDYLHTWTARIETVTRSQVQQAFKRYLTLESAVLITVGSDEAITQEK